MGCCGDKRTLLRNPQIHAPAQAANPPTPALVPPAAQSGPAVSRPVPNAVALRYLESSPILVRGMATGRQYRFSGTEPLQAVDARDAEVLLRSRFFRRSVQ
jgi:hypothetical protein